MVGCMSCCLRNSKIAILHRWACALSTDSVASILKSLPVVVGGPLPPLDDDEDYTYTSVPDSKLCADSDAMSLSYWPMGWETSISNLGKVQQEFEEHLSCFQDWQWRLHCC